MHHAMIPAWHVLSRFGQLAPLPHRVVGWTQKTRAGTFIPALEHVSVDQPTEISDGDGSSRSTPGHHRVLPTKAQFQPAMHRLPTGSLTAIRH
jgi:hypothetical protein